MRNKENLPRIDWLVDVPMAPAFGFKTEETPTRAKPATVMSIPVHW